MFSLVAFGSFVGTPGPPCPIGLIGSAAPRFFSLWQFKSSPLLGLEPAVLALRPLGGVSGSLNMT
jgi:hypothetical protein